MANASPRNAVTKKRRATTSKKSQSASAIKKKPKQKALKKTPESPDSRKSVKNPSNKSLGGAGNIKKKKTVRKKIRKAPVKKSAKVKKAVSRKPSDKHQIMATLRSEHKFLSSLHKELRAQTKSLYRNRHADIHTLRDIIKYLTEYPDVFHHPLEDQVFKRLLKRHGPSGNDIHELSAQHADLASESLKLLEELNACCAGERVLDRKDLYLRLTDFMDFYKLHIEREEKIVFPNAETYLQPEDWAAILKTVKHYDDPVFDQGAIISYAALASKFRSGVEIAGSEIAFTEMFSAYALLESLTIIGQGAGDLADLVLDSIRKSYELNGDLVRGALEAPRLKQLIAMPLAMSLKNTSHTFEAFRKIGASIGETASASVEPFSERFEEIRDLLIKQLPPDEKKRHSQ